MHIPSDQLLMAQEFLARAKIMKDNGMEETNIVKQLNEELKKCHGDDGDGWETPFTGRRFGWEKRLLPYFYNQQKAVEGLRLCTKDVKGSRYSIDRFTNIP